MEKISPKTHMMKSPIRKVSISKTSMPRSPMPKSPMPYSPAPKSPVIYEKYKSRCAYGLISIFNFRRRNSKKLIADTDRRRLSRHSLAEGDRNINDKLDIHSDKQIDDEIHDKIEATDNGNLEVNKIKGEDVSTKQLTRKKITTAKVENVQSNTELDHEQKKNQRKATKSSRRARRLPIYGCYDISTVENADPTLQSLAEKSSKSLDSEATKEVLPSGLCSKAEGDSTCKSTNCIQNDQLNEVNLQVNMGEVTEAFINQKLVDGKGLCSNEVSHQSKHFSDALDILNCNKDLFIKLLQDPNSLLVKHIEDLRDIQAKEQPSKLFTKDGAKHEEANTRECNLSTSKATDDHQLLENIVVLRPNRSGGDSQQFHYSLRNVQQGIKPAFFPFEQMKKKLMRSIGFRRKENQMLLNGRAGHYRSTHDLELLNSFDGASDSGGITVSSIDVVRNDSMDKVNEFDPGIKEEGASKTNTHCDNSEPGTNISEVKNGNANFIRKQRAKTWDGISSVPECDLFPMDSSKETTKHGYFSAKMRFYACSSHPMGSESDRRNQKEKRRSCSSPVRQNLESPPWAFSKKHLQMHEKSSEDLFLDLQDYKSIASSSSIDSSRIDMKYIENFDAISPSGVNSKPSGLNNDDVNQSTEVVDPHDGDGCFDLSRVELHVENQITTFLSDDYSSSPSKEFGRTRNDAEEQPSPVSVLDEFFTDDPLESQPALPSVRRLQISTEEDVSLSPLDPKLNSSTSAFKYISTVLLQGCPRNWDELAWKCYFSDQLLDRSMFDDINVWPDNQSLVFDYVNEVLVDTCWRYMRCSDWLSFIKPRIVSSTVTGNIHHQVMQNVDWNLISEQPMQTMEKIIENDLRKSMTWMDIRIDGEDVVSEMVDSLVEELIIEIALE
ncbi:uncharacterized protein LOC126677602 [Mercurialis annua]|uniref:uncharacterized protein LOC126677602 n=1 Tax=Mercurialis annua TaxID=3986 RepID=UPI00215F664E|nr:uncharacterized protein LOC126677602 [Mercurialis annua]